MRKTLTAFLVLLTICLIIGACAQREEVQRPAETIPEPAAEEMMDTMVMDSNIVPDSTMMDSMVTDSVGH